MNEENQISYYAIIPATVRYDKNLKPAEKLLYGEITALSNKYGYCYAKNRYFANLYNVSIKTISRWFSDLQKYGYIHIELVRNDTNEIIARHIYISDIPYTQKCPYPYGQNCQEGIDKNVYYNNTRYNIDDLFYYIINNPSKIPNDFYEFLSNLGFAYTKEMLSIFQENKIQVLKNIIYSLYELYLDGFAYLIPSFKREKLIELYNIALSHNPDNLFSYYERAIINNYSTKRS